MNNNFLQMNPEFLRKKIQLRIKEKNLTINQAEKLASLGPGAIRQFLMGRTNNPTLDTLRSVAKVLDMEVSELTEDDLLPRNSDFPWKSEVFLKISSNLRDFVNAQPINISSTEAISIIQDIYYYCGDIKESEVDKFFTEWLLKRNFKKQIRT